jgi:hypothetical protein
VLSFQRPHWPCELPPTSSRHLRWNIIDVLMIVFSLIALMLNTSGITVVRLVRVFRVLCNLILL